MVAWLKGQGPKGAIASPTKKAASANGRRLLQGISQDYLTSSFLPAVVAFFGSVSSSTPSVYFASALASSTSCASVKLRATLP